MKLFSKKAKLVVLGVLCASVVAIVTGLIIYFVAQNTIIDSQSAQYSKLIADKAFAQLMGLIVALSGALPFTLSVGYFAVALIKKIKID